MDIIRGGDGELKRLQQLQQYNILDTITERDFEHITFMASLICDVPISLISFVDDDRQWFKSHAGLAASQTPREYSFCAHAIQVPGKPFVVADAGKDDRFKDNPLVTGDPKIVFYTGIPLVNKEGYGLGTLCVIDRKPRVLTEIQITALEALSDQVLNLLELRKQNYDMQLLQMQLETRNKDLEQFAMVVAHDIKSPLTSILLANNMLKERFAGALGETGNLLVATAGNSVKKIQNLVDGILSYYKGETSAETYEDISIAVFFASLAQFISSPRPYQINYEPVDAIIKINRTLLDQVFFNLINNSIRYNDKPTASIRLGFSEDEQFYYFTVADNGIGISEEHFHEVFDLFTTVSTADTFGIKGHGIGLPTVKKIIESYGGTIKVNSSVGHGTTFSFNIRKPITG